MKRNAVMKLTLLICVCVNVIKGRYIGQKQTNIQQANTIRRNPLPQWNPSAWLRAPVPVARQRTTQIQEPRAFRQDKPNAVRRPTSTNRRLVNVSKRRFGSNIFSRSRRLLNRNSNDRMLRISLNLNRPLMQRRHNRPVNHRIHIKTAGNRRNIQISHSFGSNRRRPTTTSLGQTNSLKHTSILNRHVDSLRTNQLVDSVSTAAQSPFLASSDKMQTTETKITHVLQPDSSVHVTGRGNALLPPDTDTIVASTNKMALEGLVTIPIVETVATITKSSDVTGSNIDKQTFPVTLKQSNTDASVTVQSPSQGTTAAGSGSALLTQETHTVTANTNNKMAADSSVTNPTEGNVATISKSSDVTVSNSAKPTLPVTVQHSNQDEPTTVLSASKTTTAVSGEVTTEEPDTPDGQDLPDYD